MGPFPVGDEIPLGHQPEHQAVAHPRGDEVGEAEAVLRVDPSRKNVAPHRGGWLGQSRGRYFGGGAHGSDAQTAHEIAEVFARSARLDLAPTGRGIEVELG